jgi:hypothetical protein
VATRRIREERIQDLNEGAVRDGDYVLYWMQSSQRAEQNHALEYAVQRANEMGNHPGHVPDANKDGPTGPCGPGGAISSSELPDLRQGSSWVLDRGNANFLERR